MLVSPRILRAQADALRTRPIFTAREMERYTLILDAGETYLITHGRTALTMRHISVALRIGRDSIQRYVIDLDELVYQVIARHLFRIAKTLARIPHDAPNRPAACRAAYLEATRAWGAHTDIHDMMLRERRTLPPDLAHAVEATRRSLGALMHPADPDAALDLLDSVNFPADRIEAIIPLLVPSPAAESAPAPEQAGEPAPEPAAPTPLPYIPAAPRAAAEIRQVLKPLGRFAPPRDVLNLARAGPA